MGKREPLKEVYELKVAGLAILETLAQSGDIDLVYGDAAHLNSSTRSAIRLAVSERKSIYAK